MFTHLYVFKIAAMEENYRGSSRSKGSSSISDHDPRAKIKDCCRKVIAFMCTQVGLGAIVIGYTIVGAVSFMAVEQKWINTEPDEIERKRVLYSFKLYQIAEKHNTFDVKKYWEDTDKVLKIYQDKVVEIFKHGYSDRSMNDMWNFSAALMFSLGVITMIGYGNLVPRTNYGKLTTVIYALFGIPLYVLFFLNVGDALAGSFRWIYKKLYKCSTEPEEEEVPKRIIVPSSACVWVMVIYVLAGAAVFSAWEGWGYLDSVYFCVTSLCKIGTGDFVPGAIFSNTTTAQQTAGHSKLVLNYIYIFFGLGLVAMCYNLMREEIREKVKNIREDFAQCLEDTRIRVVDCWQKMRGVPEDYY